MPGKRRGGKSYARCWRAGTFSSGTRKSRAGGPPTRYPDIAVSGRPPEVPDLFLNGVLEAAGKWSYDPIVRAAEQGGYEAFVVPDGFMDDTEGFRGLIPWTPELLAAVRRRYEFVCMMDQTDVWLPRGRSELRQQLASADCVDPGHPAALH